MSDRFEMRGQIGAGSMGSVYRVFDREFGGELAMKTLRAFGPNALYRFKREFRQLVDLAHPNLVALHELFSVGDEWMFTMELVEGVTFREWVRADPTRLRAALVQLADGLTALHAAGKVHRDVKPSNVIVDAEGRVVILDFGLVSETRRSDMTHEGTAVGTPGYMSPEQAADVPVTAATDWYAVGTMVYEVLTGRKPFLGSSHTVLLDKQRIDPHPPSEMASDVPPDLDALTMRLLARNPEDRPDGVAVLAALGAEPSPWTLRIMERMTRPDISVSRAAELTLLRGALADSRRAPVLVRLYARRGAGRSTLIDAFADEVNAGGGLAFAVHIDRREQAVPYRGFDILVDQMTRYLAHAPAEEVAEVLPADLGALAAMFPTFRRLRAARLPEPAVKPPPDEMLRRALAAMSELVSGLSRLRPVAILLDDVHYGHDAGATATTRLLTQADAPRVLLLASWAIEHADAPTPVAWQQYQGDARDLEVK